MKKLGQDRPAAEARVPLAPPGPSKEAADCHCAAQGKPLLPDGPIVSEAAA